MLGRSREQRSSIFDILGNCCLCSPGDCSILGSYLFSFVLCKITCILQVSVIYIFSLLSAKPEMKMANIASSDERVPCRPPRFIATDTFNTCYPSCEPV